MKPPSDLQKEIKAHTSKIQSKYYIKNLEGISRGWEAAEKFRLGRNELHPSVENMIF